MDISIIGASGACGRQIVVQIIRDRLLERREILQLVSGNPHSAHPHLLHGFRADLQDAYAETVPELDVTDDLAQVIGEIVIVAGGTTFATDPRLVGEGSRDVLARQNGPVFSRLAQALSGARPDHPPIVIVVTNPVELGVHLLSQHLPRENVIGMGAYSDSLRFRWEIAHDLGLGRQRVHGYVLGEHGDHMVPLWSSVRVQGLSPAEWRAAEQRLRRGLATEAFAEVCGPNGDGCAAGESCFTTRCAAVPAGLCANAIALRREIPVNGVIDGNTPSNVPSVGDCGGEHGAELVYALVTENAGNARITLDGSDFDTVLSIYDACGQAVGGAVGCNDDSVGTASELQFPAEAGHMYFAIVEGYHGATGNVRITYYAP